MESEMEETRMREGHSPWWWFACNDNRKPAPRGEERTGTILKEGRFFLRRYDFPLFKLSWSFFGGRVLGGWKDWFCADAVVRFSLGDDYGVTLHLSLSRLASVWVTFGLPRRWLSPWMLEDREFGVRLGYIGDIAWVQIAHAEWAESTGMGDYYRRGHGTTSYTKAQLWPGWEIKIKWPPVLDWIFGRENTEKRIVSTVPAKVPLDGTEYEAVITMEAWETRRARWPWAYRKRFSSWIEVANPPQFAGKGENSWDCGDDAIYSMGSSELSPASIVGQYVKRVLENRERYGQPSSARARA